MIEISILLTIQDGIPLFLIKCGNYQPEQIAGYKKAIDAGGEVKVLSFIEGYSSSSLIEKIKSL